MRTYLLRSPSNIRKTINRQTSEAARCHEAYVCIHTVPSPAYKFQPLCIPNVQSLSIEEAI